MGMSVERSNVQPRREYANNNTNTNTTTNTNANTNAKWEWVLKDIMRSPDVKFPNTNTNTNANTNANKNTNTNTNTIWGCMLKEVMQPRREVPVKCKYKFRCKYKYK